MTLILTELSHAGIAMAADSAISMLVKNKLVTKDQKYWKKLLKVPRIKAGISYWGSIGLITTSRFDEWLELRIKNGRYTDLRSLADYLATEMNRDVGNKPLADNHQVGIHVAGLQQWEDGVSRPTLYHIHNGHSNIAFQVKLITENEKSRIVETIPTWVLSPRQLFSRHDDSESQNIDVLSGAIHLTMNGDYAEFSIIFDKMRHLITQLNTIPHFSIPTKPSELGPRLGFLKMLIEITISIYKCSSNRKHIGGKVSTLGIRPDGTYI